MSVPDDRRPTLDVKVACTLSSAGLAAQAERWTALRKRAELRQVKTPAGKSIVFRADPGVAEELAALVAVENDCCAWAAWSVETSPSEVVMHAVSSGEGVTTLHGMFPGA